MVLFYWFSPRTLLMTQFNVMSSYNQSLSLLLIFILNVIVWKDNILIIFFLLPFPNSRQPTVPPPPRQWQNNAFKNHLKIWFFSICVYHENFKFKWFFFILVFFTFQKCVALSSRKEKWLMTVEFFVCRIFSYRTIFFALAGEEFEVCWRTIQF